MTGGMLQSPCLRHWRQSIDKDLTRCWVRWKHETKRRTGAQDIPPKFDSNLLGGLVLQPGTTTTRWTNHWGTPVLCHEPFKTLKCHEIIRSTKVTSVSKDVLRRARYPFFVFDSRYVITGVDIFFFVYSNFDQFDLAATSPAALIFYTFGQRQGADKRERWVFGGLLGAIRWHMGRMAFPDVDLGTRRRMASSGEYLTKTLSFVVFLAGHCY